MGPQKLQIARFSIVLHLHRIHYQVKENKVEMISSYISEKRRAKCIQSFCRNT
jgi:hypothetical protein